MLLFKMGKSNHYKMQLCCSKRLAVFFYEEQNIIFASNVSNFVLVAQNSTVLLAVVMPQY